MPECCPPSSLPFNLGIANLHFDNQNCTWLEQGQYCNHILLMISRPWFLMLESLSRKLHGYPLISVRLSDLSVSVPNRIVPVPMTLFVDLCLKVNYCLSKISVCLQLKLLDCQLPARSAGVKVSTATPTFMPSTCQINRCQGVHRHNHLYFFHSSSLVPFPPEFTAE